MAAAVTLPLGITTSKEYAELEWPIDIAIALVWVAFTVNLMGTIFKRREKHMYVAIWFYIANTAVWALVGTSVGLLAACQLFWPELNLTLSYTTFGPVRPLHTNAVIFAFAGNAFFCGAYYSTQRLLKARMFSDLLSGPHFWGWQLIIVAAALTLPHGTPAQVLKPNALAGVMKSLA